MNDLVKSLSDISIENTRKLHQLLDEVMVVIAGSFRDTEIRFNQSTVAFEFKTDDLDVSVTRDLNRFFVAVRVTDKDSIVAECVMDIAGGFDERYAKFSNKDTKLKFSALFSNISDIDVAEVTSRIPDELKEENVPDDEIASEAPAESEAPEVEVVSEG